MNRSRFWCTVAMLTLVSACGGNQPWEDPAPANPPAESFAASPEDVFSVLPDVLPRLRLGPATRLDTERLLIETTRDIAFSCSLAGPPEAPIVRCQVMAELSRDDGSFTWLRQGQVSGPGIATIRLRVEPADGGSIVHITMIASPGSGAFVA